MKKRDIWSKKILLVLLTLAMLVSACSSTSAPQDQTGTTAGQSGDGDESAEQSGLLAESSSEATECPFPDIVGLETECTKVTVPVRWGDPKSDTIDLVVAELRSPETPEDAIPVTYLQGGPGGAILDLLEPNADFVKTFTADRPFIVMAGRSDEGSSGPANCSTPEEGVEGSDDVEKGPEETSSDDPDPAEDDEGAQFSELRACIEGLQKAGVDVTAFSTKQMIEDVEAVRLHLEIDTWKIYGSSYGTPLAMFLMEKYPEGLDSVVLESPIPIDPAQLVDDAALAVGPYENIFNACVESAECNESYPNLKQRFVDLVEKLEADPLEAEFDFDDPDTGESYRASAIVDGGFLMNLGLTSASAVGVFPKLIAELEAGDTTSVGEITPGEVSPVDGEFPEEDGADTDGEGNDDGGGTSDFDDAGIAIAEVLVFCNDMLGGVTESDFEADESKPLESAVGAFTVPYEFFMEQCGSIDTDGTEGFPSKSVSSDVPVLLLKGTLDGDFADRDMAEEFAETLPNSTVIKPDWVGHEGVLESPCSLEILLDYLNEPESATIDTCADETNVVWAPPS